MTLIPKIVYGKIYYRRSQLFRTLKKEQQTYKKL